MKKFTGEQIEAAKDLLKKLALVPAAKKKVSTREAINAMIPEILDAQTKGHSISQIADHLTSGGFEISESTLKSYIVQGKKKKTPSSAKKKSPSAAKREAKTDGDGKKA